MESGPKGREKVPILRQANAGLFILQLMSFQTSTADARAEGGVTHFFSAAQCPIIGSWEDCRLGSFVPFCVVPNHRKQGSQAGADDLGLFQSGHLLESGQYLPIGISQSNCGFLGQPPLYALIYSHYSLLPEDLYGGGRADSNDVLVLPTTFGVKCPSPSPQIGTEEMGKSPLRLIVKRMWHSQDSFTDLLECGHESMLQFIEFGYMDDHYLHRIAPTAKRRRCQECAAELMHVAKIKKPSVPEPNLYRTAREFLQQKKAGRA